MRLSKQYFQVPAPFKTKSRSCTDIVCLLLFIFCLVSSPSCHLSSGIVQYHPAENLPGLSASLSRNPFSSGGLGSSGSHSLQGWRPQKGKHSLTWLGHQPQIRPAGTLPDQQPRGGLWPGSSWGETIHDDVWHHKVILTLSHFWMMMIDMTRFSTLHPYIVTFQQFPFQMHRPLSCNRRLSDAIRLRWKMSGCQLGVGGRKGDYQN